MNDTLVPFGPMIDLHRGIHGTFLESPPEGVAFDPQHPSHSFLFPLGAGYPNVFEALHSGEFVRFDRQAPLVHSIRWPVLGARAWVADMDDFGYPLLGGRAVVNPAVRRHLDRVFASPVGPPEDHPVRVRLKHMLSAYAHPSCRSILMLTRYAISEASRMIDALEGGADGEAFLRKCSVLGPALAPLDPVRLDAKWRAGRLNVLFCGNDWRVKKGDLAVRTMARLAARHPTVRFVHVGQIPPGFAQASTSLPSNLRVAGRLPPDHVGALFEGAHVLFHPAESESLGMVLLEAAAAGLAIVCARGRGMRHLDEVVDAQGAAIVDRDVVRAADEEAAFEAQLETLLTQRALAEAMARHNHGRLERSQYSIPNRNAALVDVYERAIASAAATALTERDVGLGRPVEIVRLAGTEVVAAERAMRSRTGTDEAAVRFAS